MALNILIVDDSITVREVIEKTIRIADVPVGKVIHAGDGNEALEVLDGEWMDLVFSDINMPGMGGIEFIERLKDDETLKSIPVVVISTEGSKGRVEQLQALGVTAYIRKPFTPEQIREVIEDLVGRLGDG